MALLGSMLELGARSEELHTALLDEASTLGLDLLVATGDFARAADGAVGGASAGAVGGDAAGAVGKAAARSRSAILSVPDPIEAYEELRRRLAGDEVLLMKASRSVALERLIPLFENDFGASAPGSVKVEA